MNLQVNLTYIQHIDQLTAAIDLSTSLMACIVGRNGCGKTTFIKALGNLADATTFSTTSLPNIFKSTSQITYTLDNETYQYRYQPALGVLDSKKPFTQSSSLVVELPLPHGERFKYYQKLGSIDEALRASITETSYQDADELIRLYESLYDLTSVPHRFSQLKQVSIKDENYYFILLDDDFYIRQDYFSSGEYFVLELFRLISKPNHLVVIDELDLSLDAAAQVKLLDLIRPILQRSQSRLIFTSHSLALMKSLQEGEIYFMENTKGQVELSQRSYGYVKSALFGYKGWDRIILVEDKMTKDYIEWLLRSESISLSYHVIHIGGHENVIDLYRRAIHENYFNVPAQGILCCLDGDQRAIEKYQKSHICFLPVDSVEKRLLELHDSGELGITIDNHERFTKPNKRAKNITEQLTKFNDGRPLITMVQVFEVIMASDPEALERFKSELLEFLNLGAMNDNNPHHQ